MIPSHASLPLDEISMRLRAIGARQCSLTEAGLSEPEVWWHVCGLTREREYRANGWACSQCGATGPDGDVALVAYATGWALMPRTHG